VKFKQGDKMKEEQNRVYENLRKKLPELRRKALEACLDYLTRYYKETK